MAQTCLHGTLEVTIYEVDELPVDNGGLYTKCVLFVKKNVQGSPKIYATIHLDKCFVGRTRKIENNTKNPKWNQSFSIYCAHLASNVIFTVEGDTTIGRAFIPVQELLDGQVLERRSEILDIQNQPFKGGSKIHVKLQYSEINQNCNLGLEVPRTPFRQREGCRVSLYQDAHVPDNFTPIIPLAGGKHYEPQRCWEDIFDAITNAKHFIYIAAWSIYTQIALIRDSKRPKPQGHVTLGELLKNKASEGVEVLMLVWKDRTSGTPLSMATHDRDTETFFKNTGVHCVLCPRQYDEEDGSILQKITTSTMFTHHQKIIVVDSEMPGGGSQKRSVLSFLGGLDLCNGRYDSPIHSPFRTLDTDHRNDFHQPNYKNASVAKGGPREPWHDIHSRLEGHAAWDVLLIFEKRWKKQGRKDILVNLRELKDVLTPPSPDMFHGDPETWNVQVFQSTDGGDAFVSGKDNIVDRSIQDGYIHNIRRAKRFIYIENQYFLGSSYAWEYKDIKVEDIGALHLIPKELSLKIVSKIKAGEKFTVYVVVPMWPEGIPVSASVQAILDWQRRTMEMMYKDVVQALQAKGLVEDPRDYLTFFCLGNREVKRSGEYEPSESPDPDSDYSKAQKAGRFMIYVHSKMMIVDDEYIIVGSANINQRSMDGSRDSEIAMGAYQPNHLANMALPRGQVYGFRMALWHEHLGKLDKSFQRPDSTKCVKKVNRIADTNWDLYASENHEQDLPGHLLRYPIRITTEGNITTLPDMEFFPDTEARVLGGKSNILPTSLTV